MTPSRTRRGFTLIELMIVVAIIGLLAVVGIPKFANLVTRSTEAATRASLGSLRSALHIYYNDNEGVYPTDHLECLIANSRYIAKIPKCDLPPYHVVVNTVLNNADLGGAAIYATDAGTWVYFNDSSVAPGAHEWGDVWVGCTHADSRGFAWTAQ